jgi:hypothetical protein
VDPPTPIYENPETTPGGDASPDQWLSNLEDDDGGLYSWIETQMQEVNTDLKSMPVELENVHVSADVMMGIHKKTQ